MSEPRLVFYDWPYSPFCMKVRAILDSKYAKYRRVRPRGQTLWSLRRRGGVGKVPAIELDGKLIVDSTDIAYAIDARFPDPPLVPADPRERAICHAIEEWADESLYFVGLYYRWFEPEGRKAIPAAFGRTPAGWLTYRFYLARILGQVRGQGTLRKSPAHVARDLERHLDAVEALLSPGPCLLGDRPYLCDFALWGQLNYLNRTPVGGRAMAERPRILDYLERVGRKPA